MADPDPKQALLEARAAVPAALLGALEAADTAGYLVGGVVRDALLGVEPIGPDLDIAVEGELDPVLDRLGVEGRTHERFGTATVLLGDRSVDLARTRTDTYTQPGALPEVEPADLEADLARRDFSVNAMALPLNGEPTLIDPYSGQADVAAGVLRLLHLGSIADDPTRVLRGARYAARLGLEPDAATLRQFEGVDLGTVSAERVRNDLLRIGAEPQAVRAFALLDEWGVLAIGGEQLQLLSDAGEYSMTDPWSRLAERPQMMVAIATADPTAMEAASTLARAPSDASPPQLYELARNRSDLELAIGRAMGAEWLDLYVTEWRRVELSIDGSTLMGAGVSQGPDVGRGLQAALHARLDGTIGATPEEELGVALAAVGAHPDDSPSAKATS